MDFAESFLNNSDSSKTLNSLKIGISEPDYGNLNKITQINLGIFNKNEIRIEGANEAWVIGKAEKLAVIMKNLENSTANIVKKYLPTFYKSIFIAMIIIAPSIGSLKNRALFVIMIFFALWMSEKINKKLFPIALLTRQEKKSTWWSKAFPYTISLISTILSGLAITWLTHYFQIFK